MKKEIKKGDVVTIELGENNNSSNTFVVAEKMGEEALLHHPMQPNVYLRYRDTLLNNAFAMPKEVYEKCLQFALKYQSYLDVDDTSVLVSISLYWVVNRQLTSVLKKLLADVCGKISKIHCNNDLSIAIKIVNENAALLNEFNHMWYHNFRAYFLNKKVPETVGVRTVIFNICGFVLAQSEQI